MGNIANAALRHRTVAPTSSVSIVTHSPVCLLPVCSAAAPLTRNRSCPSPVSLASGAQVSQVGKRTLRRCSALFLILRGTRTACRSPPPLLLWPTPGYQYRHAAAAVECEEGQPCCCPCFQHQLLQLRAGCMRYQHMCRPVLVPPRRHVNNYCRRRRRWRDSSIYSARTRIVHPGEE